MAVKKSEVVEAGRTVRESKSKMVRAAKNRILLITQCSLHGSYQGLKSPTTPGSDQQKTMELINSLLPYDGKWAESAQNWAKIGIKLQKNHKTVPKKEQNCVCGIVYLNKHGYDVVLECQTCNLREWFSYSDIMLTGWPTHCEQFAGYDSSMSSLEVLCDIQKVRQIGSERAKIPDNGWAWRQGVRNRAAREGLKAQKVG